MPIAEIWIPVLPNARNSMGALLIREAGTSSVVDGSCDFAGDIKGGDSQNSRLSALWDFW
jgi:hypothetical protein